MRVGAICEPHSAANYRVAYPLQSMGRRGHDVVIPDARGDLPFSVLASCDVVLVYRRFDPPTRRTITELKRRGVGVVWDNDDDFSSMPKSRQNRRSTGGLSNQRIFTEMVGTAKLAHVTTTTTEALAAVFAKAGVRRMTVLPNMVADAGPRPRRSNDGCTIGWIAGREHQRDALGLGLADVLRRLQAKHDDLSVTTIGVELPLRERYRHAGLVAFEKLPSVMASFDIGIAPILDTAFNRARSDIKVKEYAASGVPWLASDAGPYRGLGDRQGGRLAPDDGWFDALDRLLQNATERERLSEHGRAWAATQSIDAAAPAVEAVFLDALERATGRRQEPVIAGHGATTAPLGPRATVHIPQALLRR
jgi:Glycosyl transferases group 1